MTRASPVHTALALLMGARLTACSAAPPAPDAGNSDARDAPDAAAVVPRDATAADAGTDTAPAADGSTGCGGGDSSAAHPYFNQLVRRADCVAAYSLRTQAEIDRYRFGRGTYAPTVDYDPATDAAKWQWRSNDLSAEQIRLPIRLERPATGSSRLLIVSDHRWDESWFTEFMRTSTDRLDGWKWLQVTDRVGPDSTRQRIWFEPQMRWIGAFPPALSWFGVRPYTGVRPPTTDGTVGGTRVCDMNFGESLGPMRNCFQARASTWTRIWIQIELRAGDDFARCSLWMADENQDAVPIILDAEQSSYGLHTEFWFEYNTSSKTRVGGPMAAYGRNVVVLRDLADPSTVFARPTR